MTKNSRRPSVLLIGSVCVLFWGISAFADSSVAPVPAPLGPGELVTSQEIHTESEGRIRVAQAAPPIAPIKRQVEPARRDVEESAAQANRSGNASTSSQANALPSNLFNRRSNVDDMNRHRQRIANIPGADTVFGFEAFTRAATKSDDLLSRTPSAVGLSAQKRTPLSTDLRIRGSRSGQLLASGS